jgi:hypothetical protein
MRSHPLVVSTRPRKFALSAIVLVVLVPLLTLSVVSVVRLSNGAAARTARSSAPSQARNNALRVDPKVPPQQTGAVADEVSQLRGSKPVAPADSSSHHLISGESTLQPDLFAAAFVKELLSQDYATPRSDLLSWVQAESARTTEPTIVGLIPIELRPKWAVFSVVEGSTPPVPTTADWTALGLHQGHTSVQIQRVTEPVSWSTAVAAGDINDPGVTAREVTALVTLQTNESGIGQTTVTSVALTLNLEGPPAQSNWGFVGAITYNAVPVSRS